MLLGNEAVKFSSPTKVDDKDHVEFLQEEIEALRWENEQHLDQQNQNEIDA
jgi:predicted DNA-binding protein (UPF0251 family)